MSDLQFHRHHSYFRKDFQMLFEHKKGEIQFPHHTFFLSSVFLSSDTESINFDHHLRCGGWLNFEFS